MNVIPAVDMRNGNCVRLLKGDFGRETHYSDDPAAVARNYADMGFRRLHLVDLDGARSGRQRNRKLVRRILDGTTMSVQLGGGIRDLDTLRQWLKDGVQRAVLGSMAVTDARSVCDWMRELGPDCLVLALDCRHDTAGTPRLATHGWTRDSTVSLWQCIDRYRDAGLRHVLCTDVSRDGALSGPSIDLYREFRSRYPDIELQASGGVRNIADLNALRGLGVAGAIIGRALLDGRIMRSEVASFLRDA